MKKSEVRTAIVEWLSSVVCPAGFEIKSGQNGIKAEKCAYRKIPSGRQTIIFPLADYGPVFRFSIFASIRLDAVEDIRHTVYDSAIKYWQISDTISINVDGLLGGPSEYEVTSQSEIFNAVTSLSGPLISKIVPFLDENNDVRALDRLINLENNIIEFDHRLIWQATILACLAENPQYAAVVARCRQQLVGKADSIVADYERLATYLQQVYGSEA